MLARPARSVDLTLDKDGAKLFAQALDEAECLRLEAALAALPTSMPGVRIGDGSQLAPFLGTAGPIGAIAAAALGPEAHPVRAILFDKTAERNWALGWHQDRTIVVKERIDRDGFGPWTVKSGLIQVEPPFYILERMVTLRVHLDAIDRSNAPLRIVPGSHSLGRLPQGRDRACGGDIRRAALPRRTRRRLALRHADYSRVAGRRSSTTAPCAPNRLFRGCGAWPARLARHVVASVNRPRVRHGAFRL